MADQQIIDAALAEHGYSDPRTNSVESSFARDVAVTVISLTRQAAPRIHTRYLRRGVVGDIQNAEEDVPLIDAEGYLTEAGIHYLDSVEQIRREEGDA